MSLSRRRCAIPECTRPVECVTYYYCETHLHLTDLPPRHRFLSQLSQKWNAPIAVLDIESTGTNYNLDRIVELTIEFSDGFQFDKLINPTIPIPPEAEAVHKISNEMVRNAPTFASLAPELLQRLPPTTALLGFSIASFDIPLLKIEFARVGIDWKPGPAIDAAVLYKKRMPRTLASALYEYAGRSHEGAHRASADVLATIDVFAGQLARYPDLANMSLAALAKESSYRDDSWVTDCGRIRWLNGEARIAFGKHSGTALKEIDDGFLKWVLEKDFPDDVKALCSMALERKYLVRQPTEENGIEFSQS